MSLEESVTRAVCVYRRIIDVPLRRPKPVPSCQFGMSVSFGHGTYLEESEPRCTHNVFNESFTGVSSCYGEIADVCVCVQTLRWWRGGGEGACG
jgi:hypothetical protein